MDIFILLLRSRLERSIVLALFERRFLFGVDFFLLIKFRVGCLFIKFRVGCCFCPCVCGGYELLDVVQCVCS